MPYDVCCRPLHDGVRSASSAHALMRSRFSAFSLKKAQYIYDTYVTEEQELHDVVEIEASLRDRTWAKLEIVRVVLVNESNARVEFAAFCMHGAHEYILREDSAFRKDEEEWLYWGARSTSVQA